MKRTRLRAAPALVGVIASVVALAAGPALGGPINQCTKITKPGFYELTRNLTSAGDCIIIAADFVTLDLGGWVIFGNERGSGVTDQGDPRGGIVVRNGTITRFSAGVSLGGSATVENLRSVDNEGLGIGTGSNSIISGNRASGIIDGIVTGSNSIVSGNIALNNDVGIVARTGSLVSGNTAQGGLDTGIVVDRGSTVSGNTVQDNQEAGIRVTCPSNVIGNTATNNTVANLVLLGDGCTNIDNLAP